MAGPGDEIAAGAGGRGHLRASHTDREQVIGTLKAAFVQGMLAKDEFDAGVGQTLAARTYADLAALTADLPAGPAAAKPPQPAPAQGEQKVQRPGRWTAGPPRRMQARGRTSCSCPRTGATTPRSPC
jgi:Domain of unknown function (DUF1707)